MAGYECVSDSYEKAGFLHKLNCPFVQRKENTCPIKDQYIKSKYNQAFSDKNRILDYFFVTRNGNHCSSFS